MKKLLSILGALSLTALASTTVVACSKETPELNTQQKIETFMKDNFSETEADLETLPRIILNELKDYTLSEGIRTENQTLFFEDGSENWEKTDDNNIKVSFNLGLQGMTQEIQENVIIATITDYVINQKATAQEKIEKLMQDKFTEIDAKNKSDEEIKYEIKTELNSFTLKEGIRTEVQTLKIDFSTFEKTDDKVTVSFIVNLDGNIIAEITDYAINVKK